MPRRKDGFEREREIEEGELGRLGHALALLDFLKEWLGVSPAAGDCERAQQLIRSVQDTIKDDFERKHED